MSIKSIKDLENEINEKLFEISLRYYWGSKEVSIDYHKSFSMLENLYENSNVLEAKYLYASSIYLGYGTEKNKEKAQEIYRQILNCEDTLTDINSKYVYAKIYTLGLAVDQNKKKADEYFDECNKFFKKDKSENSKYKLGLNYFYGRGVEKDYKKAIENLKKVESISEAYSIIAEIYDKGGYGVERDIDKALKYYKISAENNNKIGIYKMAVLNEQNGDYKTAVEYYNKLLDLNYEVYDVNYSLGTIYFEGNSQIDKDYEKAKYYFEKLDNLYDNGGSYDLMLGRIYMSKDYNEYNIQNAIHYFEKCNDSYLSDLYLGLLYYNSEEVRDYEKAKRYLEIAISNNIYEAALYLGDMYYNGDGLEQNFDKALELYEKAKISFKIDTFFKIGRMYYEGKGVEKNYKKALEQFYNSELLYSNPESSFYIGLIYYNGGYGVDVNHKLAFDEFKIASENNINMANYYIGKSYYWGDGVDQDVSKAYSYFEQCKNVEAKTYLLEKYTNKDIANYEYIDNLRNRVNSLNKNDISVYDQVSECDIENVISRYQNIINTLDFNDDLSLYLKYNLSGYMFLVDSSKNHKNYVETLLWDLYNSNNDFFGKYLATYSLGVLYVSGEYLDKNVDKGIALLKESAENNNVLAMNELVEIYTENEVVAENDDEANKYQDKINQMHFA